MYKAGDTRLDRIVAIKVSKTEFSESGQPNHGGLGVERLEIEMSS